MNYRKDLTTILLAITLAAPGTLTLADEAEPTLTESHVDAQYDSQGSEIEEIIVYSKRRGDTKDAAMSVEEQLRQALISELEQANAQQRDAGDAGSPSRVRLGYDPEEDASMQRDTSLTDLPIDEVKPATVIKIEF